jgi:hypothetical protein
MENGKWDGAVGAIYRGAVVSDKKNSELRMTMTLTGYPS